MFRFITDAVVVMCILLLVVLLIGLHFICFHITALFGLIYYGSMSVVKFIEFIMEDLKKASNKIKEFHEQRIEEHKRNL